MTNPPRDLALGLVTHNSVEDLSGSLPTTSRIAQQLGSELLVWDNASSDESADLAELTGQATVHRSPANLGFAAGVNGLFEMAGDRDLLLLNPDVQLRSAEQVRQLHRMLGEDGVGVVAPALRNPDGSLQESARRFPTVVGMAGRSSVGNVSATARRAAAAYTRLPDPEVPSEVDWAIGAALMISNDANRDVAGWDEGFFLYLEDVDFCFRLARNNWKTVYQPQIELDHTHHRASARASVARSRARRHHVRSALRFFAKYRSLSPTPAADDEPRLTIAARPVPQSAESGNH